MRVIAVSRRPARPRAINSSPIHFGWQTWLHYGNHMAFGLSRKTFRLRYRGSLPFSILHPQNVQTSSLIGEIGNTLWPSRNKL
jgi:hypothetical protein